MTAIEDSSDLEPVNVSYVVLPRQYNIGSHLFDGKQDRGKIASVVAFTSIIFFSHELRLKTFSLLALILETDHLLLGRKLTSNVLRRSVCGGTGTQIPCK
jgi:hypothetical protein